MIKLVGDLLVVVVVWMWAPWWAASIVTAAILVELLGLLQARWRPKSKAASVLRKPMHPVASAAIYLGLLNVLVGLSIYGVPYVFGVQAAGLGGWALNANSPALTGASLGLSVVLLGCLWYATRRSAKDQNAAPPAQE